MCTSGTCFRTTVRGASSFVYGHSGYFDVFTNAGTWLASQVSITWAPLVTVWLSFAVIVSLLWVTLYWPSELLPSTGARHHRRGPAVVGTLAIPEVWLNSLEAQVYLALLTVLLLFVSLARLTRTQFVFGAVILATAGFSGVYADLLAPVFIVRAVMERTRRSIVYAVVSGVCRDPTGSGRTASYLGRNGGTKLVVRGRAPSRGTSRAITSSASYGPTTPDHAPPRSHDVRDRSLFVLRDPRRSHCRAVPLARTADRRIALALAAAFLIVEVGVNIGAGADAGGRFAVVPIGILILMLVHATFRGAEGCTDRWGRIVASSSSSDCRPSGRTNPSNLRCRGARTGRTRCTVAGRARYPAGDLAASPRGTSRCRRTGRARRPGSRPVAVGLHVQARSRPGRLAVTSRGSQPPRGRRVRWCMKRLASALLLIAAAAFGSVGQRMVAHAAAFPIKPLIAAGGDHSCVVSSTGNATCWGRNLYGQVGDGTFTNTATPVAVSGLSGVVAIAAGGVHTCGVR